MISNCTYNKFLARFLFFSVLFMKRSLSFCSHREKLRSGTRCLSNSFYESIGNPKFISAPMVDQSNLAWRLLVRKNGANLAFSQMMHARNFLNDKNYRSDCIDWDNYTHRDGESESAKSRELDRPLIVQLAGDDPDILVGAGRLVQKDAAAVDLNLGCPQKIAKKGNYGAYLLKDVPLTLKCLRSMVAGIDCPVTAKIRCLSSESETIQLCQDIEKCGIQMLTVHGRTVDSNKLWTGPADWEIIRKIKQSVSIPVVANGGISCRADAIRCLEETGADGVMSSEALLENPKLFNEEGDRIFHVDYVKAQLATVREYLDITLAHRLPRPLFQVVRSHLFKMLYRFIDASAHEDLRQQLAAGDLDQMMDVIAQLEIRLAAVDFNTEEAEARGLINSNTWYMRHRNERSAKRILSPKRRSPSLAGSLSSTMLQQAVVSKEEAMRRMELLKTRLLEKRAAGNKEAALVQPAVTPTLSNFANFMTKTDTSYIR